MDARTSLIAELREHALILGEVTLSSGAVAQYYVDCKRATLLPAGFAALSELVAAEVALRGATAAGGLTMGADPVACAALAGGADVKAFFIRKESKQHGLQRRSGRRGGQALDEVREERYAVDGERKRKGESQAARHRSRIVQQNLA